MLPDEILSNGGHVSESVCRTRRLPAVELASFPALSLFFKLTCLRFNTDGRSVPNNNAPCIDAAMANPTRQSSQCCRVVLGGLSIHRRFDCGRRCGRSLGGDLLGKHPMLVGAIAGPTFVFADPFAAAAAGNAGVHRDQPSDRGTGQRSGLATSGTVLERRASVSDD